MTRAVDTREPRDRFLIVCEGATEKLYFDGFRPNGYVFDAGCNTLSVVEKAVALRDQLLGRGEYIDQVWAVFDHDGEHPHRINGAFALAQREEVSIAFSNRSIELWFVLHFDLLTSALSNAQLYQKLVDRMNSYTKGDRRLFVSLFPYMQTAITNAKRLLDEYKPWIPMSSDPSTTVFRLVEKLLIK